jgi:ABC-type uncharacterized transport system involved in gliding motility auxiliary subunit
MEPSSTSTPTAQTAKPVSSIPRFSIGANVVFQTLIVAAIVLMANYFNFRHFKRWDFSRNQKYALAPLTKNLLGGLKKPVQAIIFFPSAGMIAQDVSSLLREYEYASDKKLSVEVVDPYRNLLRAKELSEKYKFGNNDNIVILDYDGRSKFVNATDMAEMDSTGSMFGQQPTVRAFKGEEALTSAILEITEEKQSKLYFLGGHGESAPNAEDLSALKAYVERQNIKLDTLDLNNTDAVPADASALVIFGPKTDLSERELKLLGDYWTERNGRLFLLLQGNTKTPRLAQWLATLGLSLQQDVVVKSGTMLVLQAGQPTLRSGIVTTAVGFTPPSAKSVLKDIAGLDMQMAGLTQSMSVDPAKAGAAKVRSIQLLTTTADYWGETAYVPNSPQPASKDPQTDHSGPLTLGVALERGALQDPRVKVETGRMVLVGNSGFLSNEGLRVSDVGIDFAVHSLNWLINREQLAGIPPKPKQALSLSLNEAQMARIALSVMGVIPTSVALIGLLVWWRRRN